MSFAKSSSNLKLVGSVLYADCNDSFGKICETNIDLDQCLGNDNGRLKWCKKGKFSTSSSNIFLEGSNLVAECKNADGTVNVSRIDLNDHIYNTDGSLIFLQLRRRSSWNE
eukprot:TRINITY_DN23366_c0_g1_i1.p1 TRINITY_DN23366_c0_g1~~TRINITY_DN23366_c0_g1_i1.p1  ORF type:complete len:111 (-),score=10.61 TRINITY_DN23366_c0_g1_i1:60-392(-)